MIIKYHKKDFFFCSNIELKKICYIIIKSQKRRSKYMDNYAVKLFESLQKLKVTDENKAEVEKLNKIYVKRILKRL